MACRPFEITKYHRETYDTFTLELSPTDGNGFSFGPGQFNMLYAFGVGEIPISISGHPGENGKLIHTIRSVGSVSAAMQKMKAGDIIGVRGPFGTKWPVDKAVGKDVFIIAGGIGLAPLRPSIYHMLSNRDKYGKVIVDFGARTPDDILFAKELWAWKRQKKISVHISVDRAVGPWAGNVGVVTTLIARSAFNPQNAIGMVCGPEVMMRFSIQELNRRGIDYDSIYLSMERNMKCGIGLCGHCQYGPTFICKDGAVFNYAQIKDLFVKREL